ncbi:uncharacterized protein BDZ99DRAFT_467662 [Mytilinidion resinicola]|uniref:Uncharacterized protein n=1 Tax=Mytilinidion resinicola TaxID=574789 RepID=A0A6A6Y5X7_9PEZI|nr:uncharacterized protein BDZ99DRAFT_467662 [Mytilinidion resinicola]KAF2803928.1 hypothetical protein BDZ99DRAFT_467662 [Mytilinidion resinicola]
MDFLPLMKFFLSLGHLRLPLAKGLPSFPQVLFLLPEIRLPCFVLRLELCDLAS